MSKHVEMSAAFSRSVSYERRGERAERKEGAREEMGEKIGEAASDAQMDDSLLVLSAALGSPHVLR